LGNGRSTVRIELEDNAAAASIQGPGGDFLRLITRNTGVDIGARGSAFTLSAEDESEVALVSRVLHELYALAGRGRVIDAADVTRAISLLRGDRSASLGDLYKEAVHVSSRGRAVTPKTPAQRTYVRAIEEHDIVFGIGPAGTGKTYLAMACAVAALSRDRYQRIVLCRPAVEAGEKLGFLPGDLAEKVNPYLRPLYDALHDMMDFERAERLVQTGRIEVAPLAFMRGRTLNDSFVILDEAQNTTPEQMKMFLTRLGFASKAVVTGDVTQTDLPAGRHSGLVEVVQLLSAIRGIAFCNFTDLDVVRHPLVQEILRAYERVSTGSAAGSGGLSGAGK
jgi:phosphate starvation-inducible PhoH-like protein